MGPWYGKRLTIDMTIGGFWGAKGFFLLEKSLPSLKLTWQNGTWKWMGSWKTSAFPFLFGFRLVSRCELLVSGRGTGQLVVNDPSNNSGEVQRPTPGERITPGAWLVDDMPDMVADFQRSTNLRLLVQVPKKSGQTNDTWTLLTILSKVAFFRVFLTKFDYEYDCITLGSLYKIYLPGRLFNITQPFRASQFPSLGQPNIRDRDNGFNQKNSNSNCWHVISCCNLYFT